MSIWNSGGVRSCQGDGGCVCWVETNWAELKSNVPWKPVSLALCLCGTRSRGVGEVFALNSAFCVGGMLLELSKPSWQQKPFEFWGFLSNSHINSKIEWNLKRFLSAASYLTPPPPRLSFLCTGDLLQGNNSRLWGLWKADLPLVETVSCICLFLLLFTVFTGDLTGRQGASGGPFRIPNTWHRLMNKPLSETLIFHELRQFDANRSSFQAW